MKITTISTRIGTTASHASGLGKYENEVITRLEKRHTVKRIEYDMLHRDARGGWFNVIYHLLYKLYFTISIPFRAQGSDAIHIMSQMYAHVLMFLPGKKVVMTVHDIIPLRHSDATNFLFRWFELLNLHYIKKAGQIVTDSEFSKKEIVHELQIDPDRVTVVYPGLNERYHVRPDSEIAFFRQQNKLPEQFILYVGSDRPRKNIPILVEAFAQVRKQLPELHLIMIGSHEHAGNKAHVEALIAENHLSPYIHQLRDVPEDELALYYNAAAAFVFPSSREGFGWPPLEAFASGCPVIATDVTSLGEVLAYAAFTVPEKDAVSLTNAINQVLSDEAVRAALVQKGMTRARFFTWHDAMESLEQTYQLIK